MIHIRILLRSSFLLFFMVATTAQAMNEEEYREGDKDLQMDTCEKAASSPLSKKLKISNKGSILNKKLRELKDALVSRFSGFCTIDESLLIGLIDYEVPKAWGIGLTHSHYLLSWAYLRQEYDAEKLLSIGDSQSFKPFAPPHRLMAYINKRLPDSSDARLNVVKTDHLKLNELFGYIVASIEIGAPLVIYRQKQGKLTLTTVVGYLNGNEGASVMAFEGQKTAGELPKIIPLETLHAEMEMTKWILELTEVVNDLSIFLPKSSLLPLGMEFITQIKPFTLLMFEKTPPNQAVDSSMVSEKKRYNYCYLI